jgi:hypothetical protein
MMALICMWAVPGNAGRDFRLWHNQILRGTAPIYSISEKYFLFQFSHTISDAVHAKCNP